MTSFYHTANDNLKNKHLTYSSKNESQKIKNRYISVSYFDFMIPIGQVVKQNEFSSWCR